MVIDLKELNYKNEIKIDNDLTFEQKYDAIKKIVNAHFKGSINITSSDEACLSGVLTAKLILYDAIDLSDYEYDISINIEENIGIDQKTLDINEFLWENIVLEVPIRVTKHENTSLKGEGWQIKKEDHNDPEIDPRLAKLQELFKGGE